ncbi:hypothetical protein CSB93_1105 [Pseudomonas paraeruginosa]|uniref:Uncharacterized protein n=1 Tax=Pseudomonas paraeruginosa TaxID=2994495 RepID=A0A2R3ITG2_9PSED|nr:hypothetical protein CSB93_1105 [Pseudomonas paraeruginosa]AWE90903.1 hypothetical protein CSC28_6421 [Pseudomonas paraeruginosa]
MLGFFANEVKAGAIPHFSRQDDAIFESPQHRLQMGARRLRQ